MGDPRAELKAEAEKIVNTFSHFEPVGGPGSSTRIRVLHGPAQLIDAIVAFGERCRAEGEAANAGLRRRVEALTEEVRAWREAHEPGKPGIMECLDYDTEIAAARAKVDSLGILTTNPKET